MPSKPLTGKMVVDKIRNILRTRPCSCLILACVLIVSAIYFPVCILAYQHNCGAVTSIRDSVMLMASPQRHLMDTYSTAAAAKQAQSNASVYFLTEFKNPCFLQKHEDKFLGPSELKLRTSQLTATVTVQESATDHKPITEDVLRCLPYYYVLGWMKCGTTELFQKMMAHPHILRPPQKETHWFSYKRFLKTEDVSTYIDSFDVLASRRLVAHYQYYGSRVPLILGDHSTHTIDSWGIPDMETVYDNTLQVNVSANSGKSLSGPRLLQKINPGVKLIVLMRNPADRMISFYKYIYSISVQDFHNGVLNGIHWWRACETELSPRECLFALPILRTFNYTAYPCTWFEDAVNVTRQGLYYYYLREWLDVFPRQQFLFVDFPSFAADSTAVVENRVFPFLDIEPLTGVDRLHVQLRHGYSLRLGEETPNRLQWHWKKMKIQPQSRKLLIEFYSPFSKQLANLLEDEAYLFSDT